MGPIWRENTVVEKNNVDLDTDREALTTEQWLKINALLKKLRGLPEILLDRHA